MCVHFSLSSPSKSIVCDAQYTTAAYENAAVFCECDRKTPPYGSARAGDHRESIVADVAAVVVVSDSFARAVRCLLRHSALIARKRREMVENARACK